MMNLEKLLESSLYTKQNHFDKCDFISDWFYLYNLISSLDSDVKENKKEIELCLKSMLQISTNAYRLYGKDFIDKYRINTNAIIDIYDYIYPNLLDMDYIYDI